MSNLLPDPLEEATPATRLVYLAVQEYGPIGTAAIATETSLSTVTVRSAIRTLRDRGLVALHPSGNGRSRRYVVVTE